MKEWKANVQKLFRVNPRVDWEEKYEEKRLESRKWEFKFNKLNRQLISILDESNRG